MEIFINLLQAAISVVTTSRTFGLLYWLWIFFEKYLLILLPHYVIMLLDNCGPLPLSHHWVQEFFIILVPAHILEVMIIKAIRLLLCLCKTLVLSGKKGIQSLWTSLSHSSVVCFHSIRCLPILQDFISFRGFHSFKGFLMRLLMFSTEQSFTAVHLTLLFLTMMFGSVDSAALSRCAPACYTDPDRYCTLVFGSSECRECRLTCGNRNNQEECLQHCKGSQYFPGRVTTPGSRLTTPSSSSASLSVPTSVGTVDPEEQRMSLEVSPTTVYIEYTTQINTTSFPLWAILLFTFCSIVLCVGICRRCISAFRRRSQGNAVEKHRVTYQTARPEENFPIQESVAQGNQEELATNHSASNSTAKPEVRNNSYPPNGDPDGKDAKLAIPEDSSCANKNIPIDKSGDE